MSTNLEFLERPGCHLCDDALPLVQRLSHRLGIVVARIDIDRDDDLLAAFAIRIPVVRLHEVVIAEGVVEYKPMLAAARRVMRTGH